MTRPHLVVAATVVATAIGLGVTTAGASSDPLFPQQWSLAQVNAPAAWATSTGRGVDIGIVDTGVDLAHEDLAAKVTASTNCIGAGGNPSACHGSGQDDQGHGSHVSGIAAASTGNGKGVAGTAPDARLVVAKALAANGSGSIDDINAGIRWVVDHGARVVNLSLGDPNFVFTSLLGTPLRDGIEYAWAHGAIPVLAAGNMSQFGLGSSDYGTLHAVVVGASGRDDRVASYSSPTGNAAWALLAPGGSNDGVPGDDVLSTYWAGGKPNSYAFLAGTSMATPHVAGTLGLLLAGGLTPMDAVNRMLATVNHGVSCGSNSPGCHGRLDAAAAVAGMRLQGSAPPAAAAGGSGPAPLPLVPTTERPAPFRPPSTPASVATRPSSDPAAVGPAAAAGGPDPSTALSAVNGLAAAPNIVPDQPGAASGAAIGRPALRRHHHTVALGWIVLATFALLFTVALLYTRVAMTLGQR